MKPDEIAAARRGAKLILRILTCITAIMIALSCLSWIIFAITAAAMWLRLGLTFGLLWIVPFLVLGLTSVSLERYEKQHDEERAA